MRLRGVPMGQDAREKFAPVTLPRRSGWRSAEITSQLESVRAASVARPGPGARASDPATAVKGSQVSSSLPQIYLQPFSV